MKTRYSAVDGIAARDPERAAAAALLHVTKGGAATLAILERQLDAAKEAAE